MPKKLRLWNGRDWDCRGGHLYIAAYSVADAARLYYAAMNKILGIAPPMNKLDIARISREIKVYFNPNCWGKSMNGITPERGIWHGKSNGFGVECRPERII